MVQQYGRDALCGHLGHQDGSPQLTITIYDDKYVLIVVIRRDYSYT